MQIVVSSQAWCPPSQNHKRRELCAGLNPALVSKQNLCQLLVPAIGILRCCRQYRYTLFDRLDQAFNHTITLWPLRRSVLMMNPVILAHGVKFCRPFSSVVGQHKFGHPVPTDYIVLQESGCCFGSMISHSLCLTPLRIVIDGHQDVFVACSNFRQWTCSIQCNTMEQITDMNTFQVRISRSDAS